MLLTGGAAPDGVAMADVTHGQPQLLGDAARPELCEEHRACAGTGSAVARSARLREGCRMPPVLAARVELVLEDEEARALEDRDPVLRGSLQLPALVVVLAGRDADEHAPVAREHAMQLAQRGLVALLVARCRHVVDVG